MAVFMMEKINQFQHSFQLSLEEVLKTMKLSMEEYEQIKLQAK